MRNGIRSGVAALALLAAWPAHADVPLETIQAGVEAAGRLADYIVELEKAEKRLPKLSDPRGAELLKRLYDAEALGKGRPQGEHGFAELSQWNDVARAVSRRYLGFQIRADDPAQADRKSVEYQDELTLGFVFMLKMMGNLAQGVEARIAAAGASDQQLRDEGRNLMSAGVVELAQSALAIAIVESIRPENARALTAAIADELPVYTPVMTPAAGQLLRRLAETASGRVQDAQTSDNLSRIVWSPVAETIELPAPVVAADRASWSRAMVETIRARIRYPSDIEAAAPGAPLPSGRALVALTLDRAGVVVGAEISTSSGHPRLDEAALAVVREASPFPRPPDDVAGEQVNVSVPINFVAGQRPPEPAPAAAPAPPPEAPPAAVQAAPPAKPRPAAPKPAQPAAVKPATPPAPKPAQTPVRPPAAPAVAPPAAQAPAPAAPQAAPAPQPAKPAAPPRPPATGGRP